MATTKRKRLAPLNQPALPTFYLNANQIKLVELLSKYPADERKDSFVLRDCMNEAEMPCSYHMAWAYKNRKEIWELLEMIDRGEPYKVEIRKHSSSQRMASKSAQIENFWKEMDKDIGMNVRRCAKLAGLDEYEAYSLVNVSEGQERIRAILHQRRESQKGMEVNLVEGTRAIAFVNPADLFDIENSGDGGWWKIKALREVPDSIWQAVKEVKKNKDGEVEVKFHNKIQAQQLLYRYYGLLDTGNSATDPEELAAELRKFTEALADAVPGGLL